MDVRRINYKMFGVKELSVEHVLMFVIVAFVLYHMMGMRSCGCSIRSGNNGFSVGGQHTDCTADIFALYQSLYLELLGQYEGMSVQKLFEYISTQKNEINYIKEIRKLYMCKEIIKLNPTDLMTKTLKDSNFSKFYNACIMIWNDME